MAVCGVPLVFLSACLLMSARDMQILLLVLQYALEITAMGSRIILKSSRYYANVSPAELSNLTNLKQSRFACNSSNTMADSGYQHSHTTVTPTKYRCGHTVNNEATMICNVRNCSRKAVQHNGSSKVPKKSISCRRSAGNVHLQNHATMLDFGIQRHQRNSGRHGKNARRK